MSASLVGSWCAQRMPPAQVVLVCIARPDLHGRHINYQAAATGRQSQPYIRSPLSLALVSLIVNHPTFALLFLPTHPHRGPPRYCHHRRRRVRFLSSATLFFPCFFLSLTLSSLSYLVFSCPLPRSLFNFAASDTSACPSPPPESASCRAFLRCRVVVEPAHLPPVACPIRAFCSPATSCDAASCCI